MDTKQYIEALKKKTKEPTNVALRGALVHFLCNQGISHSIVAECMGFTRRWTYKQFYATRDFLEMGDKFVKEAYEELEKHSIVVRPRVITCEHFIKYDGYKLFIDNIIY